MLRRVMHKVQVRKIFHGLSHPEPATLLSWVTSFTALQRRRLASRFRVELVCKYLV